MKKFRVEMNDWKEEDAKVFCDMLTYASTFILKSEKKEKTVFVSCEDEHENEVRQALKRLEQTIREQSPVGKREIKTVVIDDFSANIPLSDGNIFEEMLERKMIIEVQPGVYIYGGFFLSIMRYFEKQIEEFGKAQFAGIEEFEIPVLFPVEQYEKGNYFESFPHHIMFQSALPGNLETMERFSENGMKDEELFKQMGKPKNVLRHAACVPVYSFLENCRMEEKEAHCYLITGKCFRNEKDNVSELARLDEFLMKEYVFIGSDSYIQKSIETAKQLWKYWIDTFELKGTVETANDSFFASNYQKLRLFQLMGSSKQEMRWNLGKRDDSIAVSSINRHRTHFSKPYEIHQGKGYAQSACFAFGVERLAYALLCQKGLEPEKWDDKTRAEICGPQ